MKYEGESSQRELDALVDVSAVLGEVVSQEVAGARLSGTSLELDENLTIDDWKSTAPDAG